MMKAGSNRARENLSESLRGLKVVGISHTIKPGMPVFPTHPQRFHMEWHTWDPATLRQLSTSEHAGIDLDAPRISTTTLGMPAVFWLVTLPLRIKDGSGSPTRAITSLASPPGGGGVRADPDALSLQAAVLPAGDRRPHSGSGLDPAAPGGRGGGGEGDDLPGPEALDF
jgi:hypothetical protein